MACLRGEPAAACDWDEVIALANRTLVTPAIAASLAHIPGVPPEVQGFLSEIEARSIERNRRLHAQLLEALRALNGAGIRPIAIKGTAMLAGNPVGFSRLLSDIDLIVPLSELDNALNCLAALGYRDQSKPNGWGSHSVGRPSDAGVIDLHHRIQVKAPDLRYAPLAAQCDAVSVGDAVLLVPPVAYQCLILILHDQIQEHDYYRGDIDLRHLIDLKHFADLGSLDWQAVERLVDEGYLCSSLKVQIGTFEELFGQRLPHGPLSSWERFQVRRRLWQARHPILKIPLSLATILVDPPVDEFFNDTGSGIVGLLRKIYLSLKLSRYMVFTRPHHTKT
jgi:hypothetical protein